MELVDYVQWTNMCKNLSPTSPEMRKIFDLGERGVRPNDSIRTVDTVYLTLE